MRNKLLGSVLFSIVACSVASLAFAEEIKVVRTIGLSTEGKYLPSDINPLYKGPVRCWVACQHTCFTFAHDVRKAVMLTWTALEGTHIDKCQCSLPRTNQNTLWFFDSSAKCGLTRDPNRS